MLLVLHFNLTPPSAPLSFHLVECVTNEPHPAFGTPLLAKERGWGEVFYPASAIACLILGTLNLVSQGVIYITANRISSNISQTDREAVMQAIATIKAKLPFLIDSVNDCFENQTQMNTDAHR
ncbi:hypothetical protein CEN43_01355 [Fischerella thermalis BR2B]|uniref:hypothetical protein n=1 Tax=Fischerella thermalis TaxID=372787 RepID=UPI000C805515|nr:hypothetical protein [Fischerella thermalis]PMB37016.1 hypothetical protein CEN43_01355 [Fischerella thermalis BR2B]